MLASRRREAAAGKQQDQISPCHRIYHTGITKPMQLPAAVIWNTVQTSSTQENSAKLDSAKWDYTKWDLAKIEIPPDWILPKNTAKLESLKLDSAKIGFRQIGFSHIGFRTIRLSSCRPRDSVGVPPIFEAVWLYWRSPRSTRIRHKWNSRFLPGYPRASHLIMW